MLKLQLAVLTKTFPMYHVGSYTVSTVQGEAHMHWCSLRFRLIQRYHDRSFLPPPFVIFYHAMSAIRLLAHQCRRCVCQEEHLEPSNEFCKFIMIGPDKKKTYFARGVIRPNTCTLF